MIPETIIDIGEKKNGTSIQGRNGNVPGYDMPMTPSAPFQLFTIGMGGLQTDGIPAWSYYPQVRDRYLRYIAKNEPIAAGALYSSASRKKALPWKINCKGRNVKAWAQSLFAEADGGAGFGQFVSKISTDLDTQDNGAFIELVGAGRPDKPLVGRVREIWHLDSAQCWRTFDPEFPVIYTNPLDNTYHRLHKTRVIMLSNNPQPDERARNVGFCAISRALKMMQVIRNVQTYKDEKISGKFKRGFIYGGPLTPKQFKQATDASEANAENSNFMVYNEVPVLLSTVADVKLNLMDLASLPDGFDYKTEIDTYVYILALCFGTDAREFWPASQSGATKADASVQHQKAQGKGIADFIKMIETAFNWQILPDGCEFEFDATDDEQDKQKADIDTVKATNIALYQTNGWITAQEGRALAIAQGLIDPAQLETAFDATLADDAAPMDTTEDVPVDQTTQPDQTDTFDTTVAPVVGTAAKYNPDAPTRTPGAGGPGQFTESKHPRANDGKFGSGGTTSTPATAQPAATPAAPADPGKSPIANALISFLKGIKFDGKFNGRTLNVPGDTKDRSGDLQSYLRSQGFPNAKVTAKKTKKGMSYSISGVTAKKPRKTAVAQKAIPVDAHTIKYQRKLERLMSGFIDKVAAAPGTLDSAADGLYSDFVDLLPGELTDAFGIGLAGEDPTDSGIARVKTVAETSKDYFKTSFLPALTAVSLTGLAAEDIRAALSPFISRIGLYSSSFWTSIWEGQRDATPTAYRVKRVLQQGAQHCATCPPKEGVYDSYDDMIAQCGGLPGDGSDDCGPGCRCTLETEDENGGFSPLVGEPTVFTQPLFEVLR